MGTRPPVVSALGQPKVTGTQPGDPYTPTLFLMCWGKARDDYVLLSPASRESSPELSAVAMGMLC